MKARVFVFLLMAFTMTTMAQQKKVAVYVTGQQSELTKVLGDQLVSSFVNDGKYIAIERTASFLSELSKEQGYQRTGAVDDSELSRIGKQFGVQLVCVAEITKVFGNNYVSARLIDVETAEILNTSNTYDNLINMDQLRRVCSILARDLTAETVQEKAAKEAERQRKRVEEMGMIKGALQKGYMQMGELYVTTLHPYCNKKEALKIAQSAKFGSVTGWRIPTTLELVFVKRELIRYSSQYRKEIPLIPDSWQYDSYYFWKKDDSDRITCKKGGRGYLILVHDCEETKNVDLLK